MSEITPNTPNPVREDAYVEELAEKLGIDPQYIPKSPVWRNEEEIRAIAEMFANMQGGGGSGGGVLVVHDVDGTLDKTWQEIADAGFAILRIENDIGITCSISHSDGYYVKFAMLLPNGSGFDDSIGYTTSTASGYPVMQE